MSLSPLGGGDGLSPVGGTPTPPGLTPVGGGLSSVGGNATTPAPLPNPPPPAPLSTPDASPYAVPQSPPYPSAPRPIPSPSAAIYDDAPSGPNKLLLGIGGFVIALLAFSAFFMFRTPPPVPAPIGYEVFNAADNTWLMETPKGWAVQAMGEAGGDHSGTQRNGLVTASGNAQIEVTISTTAGLVSGQLLFGSEVVPEGLSGSKASGVSKLQKKSVAKAWKNYKEVKQAVAPNGMGGQYLDDSKNYVNDSRLFEWTATSNSYGLGGKMHGYRACEAGDDLIASVVCQCSERDWIKLKPAFLHVLKNLHEAEQPGKKRGMGLPGMGGTSIPGGP